MLSSKTIQKPRGSRKEARRSKQAAKSSSPATPPESQAAKSSSPATPSESQAATASSSPDTNMQPWVHLRRDRFGILIPKGHVRSDEAFAWARRRRKDEQPITSTHHRLLRPSTISSSLSLPASIHLGIRTNLSTPRIETLESILDVALRKSQARLPRPKPPSRLAPQPQPISEVAAVMLAANAAEAAKSGELKLTRRQKVLWARAMKVIRIVLRQRAEMGIPAGSGPSMVELELRALQAIIQRSIDRKSSGINALESYLRDRLQQLRKERQETGGEEEKTKLPEAEREPQRKNGAGARETGAKKVEAPDAGVKRVVDKLPERSANAKLQEIVERAAGKSSEGSLPTPSVPAVPPTEAHTPPPSPSLPSPPSPPPPSSSPSSDIPPPSRGGFAFGKSIWERFFPWMGSRRRRIHTLARALEDPRFGRTFPRLNKFRFRMHNSSSHRRSASVLPSTSFLPDQSFQEPSQHLTPFREPPITPQAALRFILECTKPYHHHSVHKILAIHNSFGPLRSTASFNHVISICIRERHLKKAAELFQDMRRAHVRWDSKTWVEFLRLKAVHKRWTVVQHALETQESDDEGNMETLLALLPGQITERPKVTRPRKWWLADPTPEPDYISETDYYDSKPDHYRPEPDYMLDPDYPLELEENNRTLQYDDTLDRLEAVRQASLKVDLSQAATLPYVAKYKLLRSLLATDPAQVLKLTESHIRDLPPDPTQKELGEALGFVHLNLRAPPKISGSKLYWQARTRLTKLLRLHDKLRPTSFTVYLLLKLLCFARRRSSLARHTVETFKKLYGPEVEDYWTTMVQARYAMHDKHDDRALLLLKQARGELLAHKLRGVYHSPRTSRFNMRRYVHGWRRYYDLMRRWKFRQWKAQTRPPELRRGVFTMPLEVDEGILDELKKELPEKRWERPGL